MMGKKEVNQEKSIKSTIIEWVKVFGLAIILAFVITLFIKPTLVRGDSMVPTLHENDYHKPLIFHLVIHVYQQQFGYLQQLRILEIS